MHNSIPFKIIDSPEVVAIHLLHSNSIVCIVYLSPSINFTLFNDTISFLTHPQNLFLFVENALHVNRLYGRDYYVMM